MKPKQGLQVTLWYSPAYLFDCVCYQSPHYTLCPSLTELLSEPIQAIHFSSSFSSAYLFPIVSIIFCLILTTVVCMSTQGGSYNFLRTEDFGLCDSFFLEVWWPFSAGQPLLNGHSHCQLASWIWRLIGQELRAKRLQFPSWVWFLRSLESS